MSSQRNNTSSPELIELGNFLGLQDCLRVPKQAWDYAHTCTSTFQLVCDLYNFGYIMGQRAERQRKKSQKSK